MVQWRNTQQRFGLIARILHWGMALVIFGLLAMGLWMVSLPVSPFKFELYGFHKSLGLLILALGALRFFWRFMSAVPAALPSHQLWERFLSKTVHCVLYILIFVMPLSGWMMSSAGEYGVSFFGLFDLPLLISKNEEVFELMKAVHELLAFLLIGALCFHIAGALKHHMVDGDKTLFRMGGYLAVGVLSLIFLCVLAAFSFLEFFPQEGGPDELAKSNGVVIENSGLSSGVDAVAPVQKWIIDPGASSIVFQFDQYGQNVSGVFSTWSGDIVFDPENLQQSRVRIEIDVSSIETGSADRDEQARGEEWFAVQRYPVAIFESESFEALTTNHYKVKGYLTLRGLKLPVSFPFRLIFSGRDGRGQFADMSAHFTLERFRFGIGQGEWKSADAIGNSVDIDLKLHARAY